MVVVAKEPSVLSAGLFRLLGGVSIETGDFETCSMECSCLDTASLLNRPHADGSTTGVSAATANSVEDRDSCPIHFRDCVLFWRAFGGGENADLTRARRHMNW
jgi:hypothetical protein